MANPGLFPIYCVYANFSFFFAEKQENDEYELKNNPQMDQKDAKVEHPVSVSNSENDSLLDDDCSTIKDTKNSSTMEENLDSFVSESIDDVQMSEAEIQILEQENQMLYNQFQSTHEEVQNITRTVRSVVENF